MDTELLRTFLEINRTRHFGRAAQALHLTQAAVSARIKQLETLLGVRLFDRLRREIRLTSEGARLVRYADLIIAEWRKARQDISAGGAQRQLSIGGSLRLWDVLVQDWLHALGASYPDLALIAEAHTPEVLTRRLLDGVLDVAVMLEPAQLEVLQIVEAAQVELVMVTAEPGLEVGDALHGEYLMVDWGLAHALQHRRLFPDAPEPRTRLGQARMALGYMSALGRGTAYLPLSMVIGDLDAGRLHRVVGAPAIERTAFAAYPLRSHREPLIRDTLELLGWRIGDGAAAAPSEAAPGVIPS